MLANLSAASFFPRQTVLHLKSRIKNKVASVGCRKCCRGEKHADVKALRKLCKDFDASLAAYLHQWRSILLYFGGAWHWQPMLAALLTDAPPKLPAGIIVTI